MVCNLSPLFLFRIWFSVKLKHPYIITHLTKWCSAVSDAGRVLSLLLEDASFGFWPLPHFSHIPNKYLKHGSYTFVVSYFPSTVLFFAVWAATWQNQTSDCAPSEDSDQPGHPPSLIRVFAVRMKKAWVLSYPLGIQRRLWSDWADAQADLSLRWAHTHFVGFVMSQLI